MAEDQASEEKAEKPAPPKKKSVRTAERSQVFRCEHGTFTHEPTTVEESKAKEILRLAKKNGVKLIVE